MFANSDLSLSKTVSTMQITVQSYIEQWLDLL